MRVGKNDRADPPFPCPISSRFGGLPARAQGTTLRWPSATNAFMLFYDRVATLEPLPLAPFLVPAPAPVPSAAPAPPQAVPASAPASSPGAQPLALVLRQLALSPSTPLPVLLPADVAAKVMAANTASLRALLKEFESESVRDLLFLRSVECVELLEWLPGADAPALRYSTAAENAAALRTDRAAFTRFTAASDGTAATLACACPARA